MDSNPTYEASDILTFDYAMDDELKDEEHEQETNHKSTKNVSSDLSGTICANSMNNHSDAKNSKSKDNVEKENGDSKPNNKNSSDKKSNTKSNTKTATKKELDKSKSTTADSKVLKDKAKPKEGKYELIASVDGNIYSTNVLFNVVSKEKSPEYKLYVSGISEETKASDLQDLFTKHVKIIDAKIIRFSKIRDQCFGLVTFENDSLLQKATQALNKANLKGNAITLSQNSPLKTQTKAINSEKTVIAKPIKKLEESNAKSNKPKIDTKPSSKENVKDKPKEKVNPSKDSSKATENKTVAKVSTKSSKDAPSKKDLADTKKITNKEKDSKEKEKAKEREKAKEKPHSRERSRERSTSRDRRSSYQRKPISLSSHTVRNSIQQSRMVRLQEIRQQEELEHIKQERIRFQKEKERLQYERLKLEREKLEILRLEREKILKEREEVALRRQMVEQQKKQRTEFIASKRAFDNRGDGRSRSPDHYQSSSRRDETSSRPHIDSSRFDSRDSRSNNLKRSKYDSTVEYDNRRHNSNSHDRDDRKEFRRESRERRFEDSRREHRFVEKEPGNGIIDAARSFNPATESRNNWSAPVAANQWTSTTDRWITSSFDNGHTQNALSPQIIPNSMNSMSDQIFPSSYSNIALTGISNSNYLHQNRRF